MKTAVTFTSTMSPELMRWVDSIAKAEKRTRRSVLEEAIKAYQHKVIKENLRKDLESIADDPEIVELAEMGVADYGQMLKEFEA